MENSAIWFPFMVCTSVIALGGSGSDAATEIAASAKSTFASGTVGGTTVYDLTQ